MRVALWASIATAICVPDSSRADQLYGFTDERGVFHFSDAPSDPRHRRLIASAPTAAPNRGARTAKPRRAAAELSRLIRDAAHAARVDPALIEAVALVESGFDERARSPKGALGLMQLMPATATRFGIADPLDARQNLAGGARYLRELLDRFDTLPLALAAYNAGEGAVERHGNAIPPYFETIAYVPKVLNHYERLGGVPPRGTTAEAAAEAAYRAPRPRAVACC
jgi:soluble lytic murein transglycosylase